MDIPIRNGLQVAEEMQPDRVCPDHIPARWTFGASPQGQPATNPLTADFRRHAGVPDLPMDPRRCDRAFLDRLAGRIAWLEQHNPPKGAKPHEHLADALLASPIR